MSVIRYRQQLHEIPELANFEYKTSDYIFNHLSKLNCHLERLNTSVIAFFDFKKNESLAFRSDMDGLRIDEETNLPYQSKHEGNMHACGHDGHMAILLAFADYLNELETCDYNVVCIFQAAEEVIMGAKAIINSQLLEQFNPKAVFGFHLWPKLEAGKVFTKSKEMMAMACELDIVVKGKSIHVANYQDGVDSIKVMNAILNDIYDYEATISEDHLLQFGQMYGGSVRNIIAGESCLNGTMRCYDPQLFKLMQSEIVKICERNAFKYQAGFKISYGEVSAPVINDEQLVKKLNINYQNLNSPVLQAEDFGEYCSKYPSVFMFLGLGQVANLHSHDFNFDENILEVGLNTYQELLKIKL